MTKQTKTPAEKVLAATGSAKSKKFLADKLGLSYTYISGIVNALVSDGALVKITNKSKGTTGRPAATYKRAAA